MTMPPGSGEDLDALVASAIADSDFRRVGGEGVRPECNASLLSMVASHGRLDLVNDLIAAGASVEKRDVFANMGSEAVRNFLMAHCPLDAADYTLLSRRYARQGDWGLLSYCLRNGAEPNGTIKVSANLSEEAPISLLHASAFGGAADVVALLLSVGVAPDELDFEGMTPLMRICEFKFNRYYGWPDLVFWLLEYGANPNLLTPKGESPLLLCFHDSLQGTPPWQYPEWQHTNVAIMLLKYGADPNVLSPAKTTPLMLAARDNNAPLARTLLRYGADATIKAPNGKTALDVAIERKSKEVQAILEAA